MAISITVNGQVAIAGRRAGHAAAVGDSRNAWADRHQVRMRHCLLRRLHRPHQRQRRTLLQHSGVVGRRRLGDHHRGPRRGRRAQRRAAGVARSAGAAVRLLPVGNDHGRVGAARREAARHRRRHRRRDHQYLPLRHIRPHPSRDPRRCRTGRCVMGKWTRRAFIGTGALVGGGLVLGVPAPRLRRLAMGSVRKTPRRAAS